MLNTIFVVHKGFTVVKPMVTKVTLLIHCEAFEIETSYWYNNFAKLYHATIIFGIYMHIRISHHLPV